jgi:hypothetical protein
MNMENTIKTPGIVAQHMTSYQKYFEELEQPNDYISH